MLAELRRRTAQHLCALTHTHAGAGAVHTSVRVWRIMAVVGAIAVPYAAPLGSTRALLARCVARSLRYCYGISPVVEGARILLPGHEDGFWITPECTFLGVCLGVMVLYPYRNDRSVARNVADVAIAVALIALFNVMRITYAIGTYIEGGSWFWSHTVVAQVSGIALLVLYGWSSLGAQNRSRRNTVQ